MFVKLVSALLLANLVIGGDVSISITNSPYFCNKNSTLRDIRIEGCTREPCVLVKGRKLPVEIDITTPFGTTLDYAVFLAGWTSVTGFSADLGGVYLANVKGTNCGNGDEQTSCPSKNGDIYTLRTQIFADWDLKSTQNSSVGAGKTTGKVDTVWEVHAHDESNSSLCAIQVMLDIKDNEK